MTNEKQEEKTIGTWFIILLFGFIASIIYIITKAEFVNRISGTHIIIIITIISAAYYQSRKDNKTIILAEDFEIVKTIRKKLWEETRTILQIWDDKGLPYWQSWTISNQERDFHFPAINKSFRVSAQTGIIGIDIRSLDQIHNKREKMELWKIGRAEQKAKEQLQAKLEAQGYQVERE